MLYYGAGNAVFVGGLRSVAWGRSGEEGGEDGGLCCDLRFDQRNLKSNGFGKGGG